MSDSVAKTHDQYVLPPSVVSRLDVSRLLSELERVDNELTSEQIRHKDEDGYQPSVPTLSGQLSDFLSANDLTLDNDHQRSDIISQVRQLKDTVPVVHMTFATQADHESLSTLVSWFREAAHPQTVVAVGLQPGLVAGVYMRTPNKVHDFSMRARLKGSRGALVGQLEGLRGGQ